MTDRRTFIQQSMMAGAGLTLTPGMVFMDKEKEFIPENLEWMRQEVSVTDEKYWKKIRGMFNVADGFINLENGYFSPQPKSTLAFHQNRENYINKNTSWFMRREQTQAIETSRTALAEFLSCPVEELALTRNTTEAINIVISGYPWKSGDEVVIGNQDYGSMVSAYHQAAKRFGIIVKVAEIPLKPESPEEVIIAYTQLFTAKTKLVHITHLINLSGQVVPVASIADRAHAAGAEVMVDSAHCVAHLKFTIPELHADYVGASLHKWLCNPLGAGFLWMKKEHIAKIFPLTADEDAPVDNIHKFEHQGTRPIQTLETIAESIRFHNAIGSQMKEDRLRFLMRSWATKVDGISGIHINTPYKKDMECGGIANITIDGFTPSQLSEKLISEYKIFTVAIDHPAIKGVRVTPHIYNTLEEVDKFVVALKEIASKIK